MRTRIRRRARAWKNPEENTTSCGNTGVTSAATIAAGNGTEKVVAVAEINHHQRLNRLCKTAGSVRKYGPPALAVTWLFVCGQTGRGATDMDATQIRDLLTAVVGALSVYLGYRLFCDVSV